MQCCFCQKTFGHFDGLLQHLRVDEKYGDFVQMCKTCRLVFYSTQTFQDHMMRDHSTSKDQCPICGVVVKHSCNFRRHVASHSLERPFVCPHCKNTFKRKDHLKDHLLKCNKQTSFTKGILTTYY